MATDRRWPVRVVDPSHRHIPVEAIETPSGLYVPATVVDAGAARAIPIVTGAASGARMRMVVDGLVPPVDPPGNVTFELTPTAGIANLASTMTVNGSTWTQVFRVEGKDCAAGGWPAAIGGVTGTKVGAGATTYGNACFWNAADKFVQFQAYDVFSFGDVFDVGTKHMVAECLVCLASGTTTFVNKQRTSGAFDGWRLFSQSTGIKAQVRATDGTPLFQPDIAYTTHPMRWAYLLFFFHPTQGGTLYCNGTALSHTVGGSLAPEGCVSSGVPLTIGSGTGPGVAIAYVGLWQYDAMLDSKDQPVIAQQRFNAFAGLVAQSAAGSAQPTAVTRATDACMPYEVAAGKQGFVAVMPGWVSRCPAILADASTANGIVLQPEQSNAFVNSQTHGAGWTTTRATSFNAVATTQLVRNIYANAFIASAVSGTHGWHYTVASSTAGVHELHALVKPGNKTWIKLQTTGAVNATQYFNLSGAGSLGTTGAGVLSAWIRRYYDTAGAAMYLMGMRYTGTAAGHDHDVLVCDGDGVDTWTGDAVTVNCWATATGHQIDLPYVSSPILTLASGVARPADVLTYNAASNAPSAMASIEVDAVMVDVSSDRAERVIAAVVADASNRHTLSRDTSGQIAAVGLNGGASIYALASAPKVVDAANVSKLAWRDNRFALEVDAAHVAGSPDTAGTPPAALTTIALGAQVGGTLGGAVVIKRVTVKDR